MKKLILFACDPGGANVIATLALQLCSSNYEVILLGKDSALQRYKAFGLCDRDVSDIILSVNKESILSFLKNECPAIVVTGTSANDFTEKYIWECCNELNITSFAILDQWMNYGIRFSKYGMRDFDKYNEDKCHDYLPSNILVMDDVAKNEMIKEGIEPSRIIISGQPYFDYLRDIGKKEVKSLHCCLNKKYDFVLSFFSEPISVDCKKREVFDMPLGYTEKTIFDELLFAVNSAGKESKKRILIVVKLHPREKFSDYWFNVVNVENSCVDIVMSYSKNSWDVCFGSDLVCGMSSMALIEAFFIGKPILSIQIGLKIHTPFIFEQQGHLNSIRNRNTLVKVLESFFASGVWAKRDFNFRFKENVCQNIINEIDRVLDG
jgi:hypothetical protein